MDLKNELKNYQIGGIGDIKKHTLRFHSYGMRTEDGKLKIFAEYESGNPPKVFDGYPSGRSCCWICVICIWNCRIKRWKRPLRS